MTARAGLYSGSRAVEAAPIGSRSSRVPEAIAGRRRSRARCRPHRCADAGAGHAPRTDCEHNGSTRPSRGTSARGVPARVQRAESGSDLVSARRHRRRVHRARRARPAARLGDLQPARPGQGAELRVPLDSCRDRGTQAVRERPRGAPAAAVSGFVRHRVAQRAGPAAFAGRDVHRRVPARARGVPRSAVARRRCARRVQPLHPARRRRLRAAGGGAALHGDQQAVVAGKGLDRVLDREPDA